MWDWPTQLESARVVRRLDRFRTRITSNLQTRGQPLVGDFNGDGYDDIYWYTSGTGGEHLWLGTPFGLIQAASTPVDPPELPADRRRLQR